MDWKSLLTFGWMKDWRTVGIAAVVIAAVLLEKFGGVDIPGFDVGEDWLGMILIALGLRTAAVHTPAE